MGIKFLNLTVLICLFLCSCKQEKRYHTNTGLIYQVFPETPNPKDSLIKIGKTAKIRLIQMVGDSVMDDNYKRMPLYWPVTPGFGNRYNPLETFDYGLHENDSVVTTQRIDSMQRKGILKTVPKWMKGSDEWITRFKIVKVFSNDSLLQVDKMAEAKRVQSILNNLSKTALSNYIKKKNIKAMASKDGIYKELVKQGAGAPAINGKNLTMHIILTSLSGKKLNSTRDTKTKAPAQFLLGAGFFPAPVENQLQGLTAGSQVRLYVPGILLFGIEPRAKDVKAEDNWIFDLDLVAVK